MSLKLKRSGASSCRAVSGLALTLAVGWFGASSAAQAQETSAPAQGPAADQPAAAQGSAADQSTTTQGPPADQPAPTQGPAADQPAAAQQGQASQQATPTVAPPPHSALNNPFVNDHMDLLSTNSLWALFDERLVVANGSPSWLNRGEGKTEFQGTSKGGYGAQLSLNEADLVYEPRFSDSLSANVSWAWQNHHDNRLDLMEAFLNYLPPQTGPVGFQLRAGLMWPEISLEHTTGGAWSVVNTITPSAINTWVGEEVKVVGFEPTLRFSLGDQNFTTTAAVFEYNDTAGTLLSFRGWALDTLKATATADFPLPNRSAFLDTAQQNETKSTDNVDHNPGWYARVAWAPPWPFGVSAFYYDNRGNPQAFQSDLQWGWRTRFWNLGLNADLTPTTKLLAQGMVGSTIMGFNVNGEPWVHTDYQSAYVLVTQTIGPWAVTGRAETFATQEHGSEMPPGSGENGWALTAAARINLTRDLTLLGEVMNVESDRDNRVTLEGLPSPFESQTVFQFSLRYRI
jgi:hypothetical protein